MEGIGITAVFVSLALVAMAAICLSVIEAVLRAMNKAAAKSKEEAPRPTISRSPSMTRDFSGSASGPTEDEKRVTNQIITNEDIEHLGELRDQWMNAALSTERVDRPQAEATIRTFYKWLDRPDPQIVWADGLLTACHLSVLLNGRLPDAETALPWNAWGVPRAALKGSQEHAHFPWGRLRYDLPLPEDLVIEIDNRGLIEYRNEGPWFSIEVAADDEDDDEYPSESALISEEESPLGANLSERFDHLLVRAIASGRRITPASWAYISALKKAATIFEERGGRIESQGAHAFWLGATQYAFMLANTEWACHKADLKFNPENKLAKALVLWAGLVERCGFVSCDGDLVIAADRPSEIHLREGHLHRDGGPAMAWRDGWHLWVLNGVLVPQELAETPAGDLDAQRVVTEQNGEVRREIVRKIGLERVCEELRAESIEEENDYELLRLQLPGEPDRRTWRRFRMYLKMRNPSTGDWHIEGVGPRCESIRDALVFRNGTTERPTVLT